MFNQIQIQIQKIIIVNIVRRDCWNICAHLECNIRYIYIYINTYIYIYIANISKIYS